MSADADRRSKRPDPPPRWWVVVHVLFAAAFWTVVAVKGSDIAFYFAVAFTVRLTVDGTLQWVRSKGIAVPEWAPNEAYISRVRRWHRSRTNA